MLGPYMKAIAAVVVSAIGALVTALGPGDLSLGDISNRGWLEAALVVLASGGLVWFVENVPGVAGGVIKAVIAALTAGFGSLVFALEDNVITQSEWLTSAGAAIVATGLVYQVANRPKA